jgi:hypothetical protein
VPKSNREPISEEHLHLGQQLRQYRRRAGATTRGVQGYTTGHISNVENGHVTPSRELVELYIQRFDADRGRVLDAFARMRAGTEQRRRDKRLVDRPPVEAVPVITEDSDFAEIRSGYQIREYEAYYSLDQAGVIRKVHAIRKIRANYPGISLSSARFNYPADSRAGVVSIQAGHGCTLARSESTNTGYTSAVLRLSREINPADEHAHWMSFITTVDSDVIALPVISYYARSMVTRYSIRLFFAESFQPQRIWRFRGMDRAVADARPRENQMLGYNPAGFYHWDFHNLHAEYVGIAWSWY